MSYYFAKKLNIGFEDALNKVAEKLKEEGFGVLTEINVKETFKQKLNVDFRNYRILGACSPTHAYKALSSEDKVGTMLPCNVIVQELDENQTEIAAVDPIASMMAIDNIKLVDVATDIQQKLRRVIDAL